MIPPHQLIKAYGHRTKKALGQHFLTDVGVLARITSALAPTKGELVLEVGPGPGVLTSALLDTGARVLAVEKDRHAVRFLRDGMPALQGDHEGSLEVLEGDLLKAPWRQKLMEHGPAPWAAVGNLPYNVGTAILMHLLEQPADFSRLVFMFQREVAERLVASPGTKKYGSLSLAVQSRVTASTILTAPPGAFSPPPKVHSQVVRFKPLATPLVSHDLRPTFDRVCRAAFSARRKTIRNSLKGGLGPIPPETLDRLLAEADINPRHRPEQIDLSHYIALAQAMARASS